MVCSVKGIIKYSGEILWPTPLRERGREQAHEMIFSNPTDPVLKRCVTWLLHAGVVLLSLIPLINRIMLCCLRTQSQSTSTVLQHPVIPIVSSATKKIELEVATIHVALDASQTELDSSRPSCVLPTEAAATPAPFVMAPIVTAPSANDTMPAAPSSPSSLSTTTKPTEDILTAEEIQQEIDAALKQGGQFKTKAAIRVYLSQVQKRLLFFKKESNALRRFIKTERLPDTLQEFQKMLKRAEAVTKEIEQVVFTFNKIYRFPDGDLLLKEFPDMWNKLRTAQAIKNQISHKIGYCPRNPERYACFARVMNQYKTGMTFRPEGGCYLLETINRKISIGLSRGQLGHALAGIKLKSIAEIVKGPDGQVTGIIKEIETPDGSKFLFDLVSGKVIVPEMPPIF